MPTQNILSLKNILKRPSWIFSLAVQCTAKKLRNDNRLCGSIMTLGIVGKASVITFECSRAESTASLMKILMSLCSTMMSLCISNTYLACHAGIIAAANPPSPNREIRVEHRLPGDAADAAGSLPGCAAGPAAGAAYAMPCAGAAQRHSLSGANGSPTAWPPALGPVCAAGPAMVAAYAMPSAASGHGLSGARLRRQLLASSRCC